ncbi:MAG: hypothetical protein U1G07_14450 [Verrucomicrobiota bacterium]
MRTNRSRGNRAAALVDFLQNVARSSLRTVPGRGCGMIALLLGMAGAARSAPAVGSGVVDELSHRDAWVQAAFERSLAGGLPFSFNYEGRPSSELLSSWDRQEGQRRLDESRTEHSITWTEPSSGLVLRCVVLEYTFYPTVEWTLSFKNTGTKDTQVISDVLALDATLGRAESGEFLLHHLAGSTATIADYRPYETRLAPNANLRLATARADGEAMRAGLISIWSGAPLE